ncbi:sensor domain-containing diguanylate cyclase [Thiomicrorhabdus sp. ZW0627]|uniref:sensor domain-containing diguanylate cyclase n=1 Tax=Thiomicrorhabdus sp. ZW0627 TaxID=3039774 RepID=UPI0024364B15|nr:sensor domain-containing diguanylate cyclase [Thiomicrorhabdus sp. ZW0627]MDG6773917.1 sensor domain-containing diguanylate cyclase [Thiomicrorhabdus sp. ZW0627]
MDDLQALIHENQRLKQQLADYRYLFNTCESAIIIIDSDGTYLDYNQAYYSLMGYTKKSQLEKFHPARVSPPIQPDGQDSFDKANQMIAIAFETGEHSFEWMHQRTDGHDFLSRVTLTRIEFNGQKALRAVIKDITETRKLERLVKEKTQELALKNEKLEQLSYTDPLTGLYNRRKLDSIIENVWDFSSRTQSSIGLLFLDIDNFKAYNDNYGHGEGDEVLQKLAQRIQETVKRKTDYVARYGGEEFVIVLAPTNVEFVEQMAEEVLQAVRDLQIPHEFSAAADHVTVSIGCAVTHPGKPERTPEEWIESADDMLYEAKENGKDRFAVRLLE